MVCSVHPNLSAGQIPKMFEALLIAGTRPNFVKIGPLVSALADHSAFEPVLVHTGQHYDQAMSEVFFEQLELPVPDIYLGAGSGTHAVQTARVMQALEPIMMERMPDVTVVVGDVNSTLAAALTASKLHIPIAHVEAGLRSGDRRMPEEINRIATDSISDFLFVTEEAGRANLLAEGHKETQIFFAGNVMIDSLRKFEKKARKVGAASSYEMIAGEFVLITAHRPEMVDHPDRLAVFVDGIERIARLHPVLFPAQPRTRQRLEDCALLDRLTANEQIHLAEPLGYLEFTGLIANAGLVVTDSGGIQEETTALGVPCATVRDNTERPCTVSAGTNELVPLDANRMADAAARAFDGRWKVGTIPELWDGQAAGRVVDSLYEMMSR